MKLLTKSVLMIRADFEAERNERALHRKSVATTPCGRTRIMKRRAVRARYGKGVWRGQILTPRYWFAPWALVSSTKGGM